MTTHIVSAETNSIVTVRPLHEKEFAMGFFGNLIGSADSSVLHSGILGRGEITGLPTAF